MKKIYSQPEWKLMNFVEADVITSSGDGSYGYDPDGFGSEKTDEWNWN